MLGLMTSEQLEGSWSLNARRRVFYQYPNGAAPLMGLLSLVDDAEEGGTDKPEWGWHEDRNATFEYTTVISDHASATGPYTATDGTAGATSDATQKSETDWDTAIGTPFRVQLSPGDADTIQVRDVLQIQDTGITGGTVVLQGVVTAVWDAHDTIDLDPMFVHEELTNDSGDVGLTITTVGSATAEADRSKSGWYTLPIEPQNYTQIFRHAFEFSRTALKEGLTFDASGAYKTKAKKNSLKHMVALEYACLFSDRTKNSSVVTEDSNDSIRRTMGGILWFLKQWELGSVANGGAFDYRPNGSDITATAWNGDDDKRVLNVGGAVTQAQFEDIIERAFRYTNDSSFEKLVLCGGGLLKSFNQFVDGASVKQTKLSTNETYGMNVTSWESPFGVLHFKTHPLLTQTALYRNSAFILDVGELKYTPLNDSDTNLLKFRQPRDFDGRKDEWLTEAGIEVRFPENHMFLHNVTGIS